MDKFSCLISQNGYIFLGHKVSLKCLEVDKYPGRTSKAYIVNAEIKLVLSFKIKSYSVLNLDS